MKDYRRLFKIATVFMALGIFFMTMLAFIVLVYTKDYEDVMRDPFSAIFLRWPIWTVLMTICYIPGITGLVIANRRRNEAIAEHLRISEEEYRVEE